MLRRLIVPLCLLALPHAAIAADDPPDCHNQLSTYEQQYCADNDFQAADKALNAAFKMALGQIAKSDQGKPYDSKSWEAAMRTSQRAWVAFRDADCKGDVPFGWSGGTGTTTAVLGCMIGKTKARTEELRERYTPP
jgi:uncharacterized protein YecT (DUF1311 family)